MQFKDTMHNNFLLCPLCFRSVYALPCPHCKQNNRELDTKEQAVLTTDYEVNKDLSVLAKRYNTSMWHVGEILGLVSLRPKRIGYTHPFGLSAVAVGKMRRDYKAGVKMRIIVKQYVLPPVIVRDIINGKIKGTRWGR